MGTRVQAVLRSWKVAIPDDRKVQNLASALLAQAASSSAHPTRMMIAILGAITAACSNQPGHAHQHRDTIERAGSGENPSSPPMSAARLDVIAIPAGSYPIGRDTGPRSQRPAHSVVLDAFWIERTEVTNSVFAAFLNALRLPVRGSFAPGGITGRNGSADAIRLLSTPLADASAVSYIELDDSDARIEMADGRLVPTTGFEQHPVTEVTWSGAMAYCRWRGGILPSEVQWEAAARGPDDRRFPWGNAPPESRLLVSGGPVGNTAPVGSRPAGASPFGVLDMAGSLAEWTTSLKLPYPYRREDGREVATGQGERVTRGGDYEYDSEAINHTVSYRDGFSNDPRHGHRHVGFRCVFAEPKRAVKQ